MECFTLIFTLCMIKCGRYCKLPKISQFDYNLIESFLILLPIFSSYDFVGEPYILKTTMIRKSNVKALEKLKKMCDESRAVRLDYTYL